MLNWRRSIISLFLHSSIVFLVPLIGSLTESQLAKKCNFHGSSPSALQSRVEKSGFEARDNCLITSTHRHWGVSLWNFGIQEQRRSYKLPEGVNGPHYRNSVFSTAASQARRQWAMPSKLGENDFRVRTFYPTKLLSVSIECRHFKTCKVSKNFFCSLPFSENYVWFALPTKRKE